jgi:FAD/FMN-containing dehydrogenase
VALDVTVRLVRDPQAVRTLLADFMSVDAAARAAGCAADVLADAAAAMSA